MPQNISAQYRTTPWFLNMPMGLAFGRLCIWRIAGVRCRLFLTSGTRHCHSNDVHAPHTSWRAHTARFSPGRCGTSWFRTLARRLRRTPCAAAIVRQRVLSSLRNDSARLQLYCRSWPFSADYTPVPSGYYRLSPVATSSSAKTPFAFSRHIKHGRGTLNALILRLRSFSPLRALKQHSAPANAHAARGWPPRLFERLLLAALPTPPPPCDRAARPSTRFHHLQHTSHDARTRHSCCSPYACTCPTCAPPHFHQPLHLVCLPVPLWVQFLPPPLSALWFLAPRRFLAHACTLLGWDSYTATRHLPLPHTTTTSTRHPLSHARAGHYGPRMVAWRGS